MIRLEARPQRKEPGGQQEPHAAADTESHLVQ